MLPSRYRPNINGLRAVAVLGVLCYHVPPLALPGGSFFVGIFFVVSDYLKVIYPAPGFCDLAPCSGYLDNELLYADDNHLSVTGSVRLAPSIMSALNLDAVQSPAAKTELQQ